MFHTCLMAYKSVNECFIGVALSFLGTTDTCALNMSSSDPNFYFIGYGNSTMIHIFCFYRTILPLMIKQGNPHLPEEAYSIHICQFNKSVNKCSILGRICSIHVLWLIKVLMNVL